MNATATTRFDSLPEFDAVQTYINGVDTEEIRSCCKRHM